MPYEFEYNGEVLKFEADAYKDVFAAMGEANKQFDLPEGAWFEVGKEPGKFRWVEGNFFD
jgi:hypothetical protein